MSTGLVPNVGEERMAQVALNVVAPESLVLRLYKNDLTPSSTMTLSDYTEATFTGYAAVTLSTDGWTVTPGAPTVAEYSSGVPFTCSGTTSEGVYGFYLSGANSSTLYWSERFDVAPRTITYVGDSLVVKPKLNVGQSTGGAVSTLVTGLVSYWALEETSGTRYDLVGYPSGNNLSDNNTVGYDTGVNGNAANFTSSSNEVLSKATASDLAFGDADFTVGGWFKTSNASCYFIMHWDHGTDWNYRIGSGPDGKPFFQYNDVGWPGKFATWGSATNDGNWHLYLGWNDATANKIYFSVDNGTPVETATGGTPAEAVAAFGIGNNVFANGNPADAGAPGIVADEVAIWSRALSAPERAELYNGGSGKFFNGSDFV